MGFDKPVDCTMQYNPLRQVRWQASRQKPLDPIPDHATNHQGGCSFSENGMCQEIHQDGLCRLGMGQIINGPAKPRN